MSSERYGGEDPIALHSDDVTVVHNEDTGQTAGYLTSRASMADRLGSPMARVDLDDLEVVATAAINRPDETDDAARLENLADLARDAVAELRAAREVVHAMRVARAKIRDLLDDDRASLSGTRRAMRQLHTDLDIAIADHNEAVSDG